MSKGRKNKKPTSKKVSSVKKSSKKIKADKPQVSSSSRGVLVNKFEPKIDIESSKPILSDLTAKERNRIYQYRFRLKKRLKTAKNDKQKRLIRNEIVRTTRYLQNIQKKVGKKPLKKIQPTQKEELIISDNTITENVFKWEASKTVQSLLQRGYFKKFIVQGIEYSSSEDFDILFRIDEMETEADLTGLYKFTFYIDVDSQTVTITF